MDISVVVPTRNRAKYLEKFFCSLMQQSVKQEKYELIVIDNGSTDKTKKVCEKWQGNIKNFRYIYDDKPGLHIGRNIGYQQSSSDLIVFADDDIEATPTWLEAICNGFNKHADVVLIGGSDIPRFEEAPPQWIETLWRNLSDKKDEKILVDYSCIMLGKKEKEISPYYVFGCNFAIRKWVLDKTHGFHPDGMPDELLCYRGDGESFVSNYIIQNGLKALFVPAASVYHAVSKQRMSFQYISKVAYRNGISTAFSMLRERKVIGLQGEIWKKKFRRNIAKGRLKNIELIKENKQIEGMEFLLMNYRKCKKVQEWIQRSDYLGENGVIPYEKCNN